MVLWVADKLPTRVGITLKSETGKGFCFCLGFFVCMLGEEGRGRASYLVAVSLPECILLPFMYVFLEVLISLSGTNFVEAVLSTVQQKVS